MTKKKSQKIHFMYYNIFPPKNLFSLQIYSNSFWVPNTHSLSIRPSSLFGSFMLLLVPSHCSLFSPGLWSKPAAPAKLFSFVPPININHSQPSKLSSSWELQQQLDNQWKVYGCVGASRLWLCWVILDNSLNFTVLPLCLIYKIKEESKWISEDQVLSWNPFHLIRPTTNRPTGLATFKKERKWSRSVVSDSLRLHGL